MAFENVFDSSLVDYSKDFEKNDKKVVEIKELDNRLNSHWKVLRTGGGKATTVFVPNNIEGVAIDVVNHRIILIEDKNILNDYRVVAEDVWDMTGFNDECQKLGHNPLDISVEKLSDYVLIDMNEYKSNLRREVRENFDEYMEKKNW